MLLDIATKDPRWLAWSEQQLARCAAEAPLVVNPIIYAEVSVRIATIEELDAALPADVFERAPLPWEAAYLAGRMPLRSHASPSSPVAGVVRIPDPEVPA